MYCNIYINVHYIRAIDLERTVYYTVYNLQRARKPAIILRRFLHSPPNAQPQLSNSVNKCVHQSKASIKGSKVSEVVWTTLCSYILPFRT